MSAIEDRKQRVAAHREQSPQIRASLGVAEVDRWVAFSPSLGPIHAGQTTLK